MMLCVLLQTFQVFAQQAPNHRAGETEDFRRSSLCLMLITHNGDKYAQDLQEQFLAMPLPSRYNGLNVDVRVINTYSKPSDSEVARLLRERGVAKELVAKWFNRDYYGRMSMDRIHQWGGYNASYADLQRANQLERGTALLSDEGSELIKNTFVLVCDLTYYDRSTTGGILSVLAAAAGAVMEARASQYEKQGKNASAYRNLAETAYVGSAAAEDIAGFSVNVNARLYRLRWDNNLRDYFYTQYWVGSETPSMEADSKKRAFDNDNSTFQLDYLGNYTSRAGRTVSKSANDLNLVIRDVCSNAVNRSITYLSRRFPVFKAKTQFYCEGGYVYAYIGSKEGVTNGAKFEVLETKKTSNGFEYHKVAQVKANKVWDNEGLFIENMSANSKGTRFYHSAGRSDICDQGLLIREQGKLGYQYKRHNWYFEPFVGVGNLGDKIKITNVQKKAEKQWQKDNDKNKSKYLSSKKSRDHLQGSEAYRTNFKCQPLTFGLSTGWVINYHTNIAWNPFNIGIAYGTSKIDAKNVYKDGTYTEDGKEMLMSAYVSTGFIVRTSPLAKNGAFAFYLWPTIGARFSQCTASYKWGPISDRHTSTYRVRDLGILDWNVKAGVTLSKYVSIGGSFNDLYMSGLITFYL